jgi:hypothetical protein
MLGTGSIKRRSLNFVLLMCVFCLTVKINWREAIPAEPGHESLINCDIQQGPCTKNLAGMTVTLDIQPSLLKL